MKTRFSSFNEKLFFSNEISSVGAVGTLRLLRGSVAKLLNFVGRSLAYTSTRSYGCFLMSFGILSLLLHLGEYYFKAQPEVSLYSLAISAVLAVVAIPLLAFSKPMCIAVQDFPLTDRIFFEFLSIKRMHRNVEHKTVPPLAAIFFGFIPAVIGFFISVEWVLLGIVIAAVAIIAFTSPEFSLILTVVLLPYLPLFPNSMILLCSLSLITFVSYAMKVIIGKRSFCFDVYSVMVILIMLFVFIGGVSGYGGSTLINSLAFITLLLGYFPVSNMVINRRLVDSVIDAVIVSVIPITVISIIEFFVELPSTSYKAPEYSTPGTSAFFSSPAALCAFLLVSSILTLVFVFEKKSRLKKSLYVAVFALEVGVLGIVMQPGAWVAAIFAVAAYFIIRSRKIPIDSLVLLLAIAHLVFLIPKDALDAVYGYFGLSPLYSARLSEYGESLRIFGKNIWFGVDAGTSAQELSADSYNTLLGVGVELGIFVLILFAFILIIRFRHLSYYRLYVRNSLVSASGDMTAAAMVALLVFGAFENVFADVTVMYVFLLVFALSTAILRTAKKENDDRLGYYGDSRSSDSSALDVSVSRLY